MSTENPKQTTSLSIDYPGQLNRVSTFFRIIWALPILIISSLVSASSTETFTNEAGKEVTRNGGGIAIGLFAATALLILFRQRYPKWWFNFLLEYNKFSTRVGAYLLLMTDTYPSTEDEQAVHLHIAYPNVKRDLNKWSPLYKWFLAIPHYIILFVLTVGALLATILAWFNIIFTGIYPKSLFDFVLAVMQWHVRVNTYAFLLVTDDYPPFQLKV